MIAVALLAASSQGWVAKSQSIYGAQIQEIQDLMNGLPVNRVPQAQLGYLWHSPENVADTRGLGGGITWAFNPALCALLEPVFQEDIIGWNTFVDCRDFHSAIARAFDKWSANNRYIKFLDVSNECETLGQNYGPPTDNAQPGMPHGGCPLAEIWVTAMAPAGRRRMVAQSPTIGPDGKEIVGDDGLPPLVADFDLERQSEASGSFAVATAQPHPRYAYDFRYTNGARPFWASNPPAEGTYHRPVVETYAGTFTFNVENVCWYLDSQFCYRFHKLKASLGSASDARLLVYGLTLGCTVLGALFYCGVICAVCLRFTGDGEAIDDEDGDGKISCGERVNGSVREISHYNPMCLAIFLGLLFIPPLVTARIFRPCFDCYDFEAAALHEIGHFIGLGHPDNIPSNWAYPTYDFAGPTPGNNSYHNAIAQATQAVPPYRPNGTVCENPWQDVHAGVPSMSADLYDALGGSNYPTRESQMEAFTQHNPLTCLRDDDLEGLQVLYPDCGPYALYTNVCHIVELNIGYVRTSVYLLGPLFICLLVVVTFNSIIHGFEKREQKRLLSMNESLMAEALAAKHTKGKLGKAREVEVMAKARAEARKQKHASQQGFSGINIVSSQE